MWISVWVGMPKRLWRNVGKWSGGSLRRLFAANRGASSLHPVAPTEAEWAALAPFPVGDPPTVDIVIPVYDGRTETLQAIHRVLSARNRGRCELVLINDRSPDAVINARLEDL